MTKSRCTGVVVGLTAVVALTASVWAMAAWRSRAIQAARESLIAAIASGATTPDARGIVPVAKGTAGSLGCVEVFATRGTNGFLAVVFIERRFKSRNFKGCMYVSSPLGSAGASQAGFVSPGPVGIGDQLVYVDDQINANWHRVYSDID